MGTRSNNLRLAVLYNIHKSVLSRSKKNKKKNINQNIFIFSRECPSIAAYKCYRNIPMPVIYPGKTVVIS